ncbi:hypothetical protein BGZ76_008678 [Entomortierella beljakovae]|nr:hypothetical protein BGZ76_008678 [Entomortierella beljakovae]
MTLNPFEIPEIRSRLSRFVSVNTALSCVQVSKAFSKDFIYPIWNTIDFTTKPTFENLAPSVVANNGRYIRVVKGIKNQSQLNLLLRISFNDSKLTEIHPISRTGCDYDLIRRNQTTLIKLNIENTSEGRSHIYLDCLTSMINQPQSSRLASLTVRHLALTRSSFVSVLRCCPALKTVDIWGTTIDLNFDVDDFQHKGVTLLVSYMSDAILIPPILIHFPKLKTWSTFLNTGESLSKANDIILQYCPHLKKIETNWTPSQHIISMINSAFLKVTCLTLDYQYMTQELVLEIARFPKWESIIVYHENGDIYEENQIYIPWDHLQTSSWMIQLIPRVCHKLEEFIMTYHIMDMNEVEKGQWVCRNLKDLKMGIKGLDTIEKINATIDKYREGKRLILITESESKESKSTESESKESESTESESKELESTESKDTGDPIEVRVARHLLQFDNLETIWLGTKIWVVKEMDFS